MMDTGKQQIEDLKKFNHKIIHSKGKSVDIWTETMDKDQENY
jgi:hypothetical protein